MNGQGGGPERQAERGEQGNEADARARRLDQTAVFIGAVVAIATLAIGAGLLYFLLHEDDADSTRADATAAKKHATTTSTAPGSSTTAPGGGGAAATLPATGGGSGGPAPTTTPPTPMATADPTDPPYVPQPIPAGVTVTLTPGSCRWSPANGGQLEASGTITSATDDAWIITAYWLQNGRELDETDSDFYDFDEAAGTTKTWQLTTTAPLPPADLACAVEVF